MEYFFQGIFPLRHGEMFLNSGNLPVVEISILDIGKSVINWPDNLAILITYIGG